MTGFPLCENDKNLFLEVAIQVSVPFSDFYTSLDPDPLKRGKQFEHFVKWFLKADPEWATQVDQVWLWEEWPQRWGGGLRC